MTDSTLNLLEEIDNATKIHELQRDDTDALLLALAKRITGTLNIERNSVWLFNEKRDAIVSLGEFDTRDNSFKKGTSLSAKDFSSYFKALNENKILLAPDMIHDPKTFEFTEAYSKPNDIVSLMDIPLRIRGELIGVMCFEKTGKQQRLFTDKEQTFAFSLSLVFASNLEARYRQAMQYKLENVIKEKEMLIAEINHRVKNNFSILISLLRLSKMQGKTNDPKIILDEYEQRVFSMMKIHDLLYQTKNYSNVNLGQYLGELIKEFRNSHPEIGFQMKTDIDDQKFLLSSRSAIRLGLVITEIFLNFLKHDFLKNTKSEFIITLKPGINNSVILIIGNTGEGFDFNEKLKGETLGLLLIKEMSEDFCERIEFPTAKNGLYVFEIKSGIKE